MKNLETKRLLLRAFNLADAKAIQQLAGDKDIADNTANIPHPYEDGFAEKWIERVTQEVNNGAKLVYAITFKNDGALIGTISMILHNETNQTEFGYWIGKPFWNKGYCTEAATVFLDYVFNTLKLKRLTACVFKWNKASSNVLNKLGFTCIGECTKYIAKWNKNIDFLDYELVRKL